MIDLEAEKAVAKMRGELSCVLDKMKSDTVVI
jgi:hypothetical protein